MMTLDELVDSFKPINIDLVIPDIDDDEDICQLMARKDEEVLTDWKTGNLKGNKDLSKVILVVDDEGNAEYMEELPDGSLKSYHGMRGLRVDGHLGGVED